MVNPLRSLLREPLHPPTTHFPMALYPMVVIFDVLALTRQAGTTYTHAAFVVIVTASVMAGIALLTGFVHLLRDVPPDSRAWRLALLHGTVQLTAGSILFASMILRFGHINDARPPTIAFILAIAGTVLLLSGGWLGGRLVYFHGVGVRTRNPAATELPRNGVAE